LVRRGQPPYLECSSRGDRRFSAFFAMVDGKSIERRYQESKRFADGSPALSWKDALGRKPSNTTEVRQLYSQLWDQYIQEHPELLAVLKEATGLSDVFGQPVHVCQAIELWRIRNEN